MKNTNKAIIGGVMFCTGLGMIIIGIFRFLDTEILEMPKSFDIAHDTSYDMTLGNFALALFLIFAGLIILSSMEMASRREDNEGENAGE